MRYVILLLVALFSLACGTSYPEGTHIYTTYTSTPVPTPAYTPVPTPTAMSADAHRRVVSRNQEAQENFAVKPQLDERAIEKAVLRGVNSERTKRGLIPMDWNGDLASISRGHSQEMSEHNYLSHYNRQGQDHVDRGEEKGITCQSNINGDVLIGLV